MTEEKSTKNNAVKKVALKSFFFSTLGRTVKARNMRAARKKVGLDK